MAKIMLTESWRWYKAREIIDVTPGQKTLLLTLCKGIEYIEPEPVVKEPEVEVIIIVDEPEVIEPIIEKPEVQETNDWYDNLSVEPIVEEPEVIKPVVEKPKRKYKPRKTKRKSI